MSSTPPAPAPGEPFGGRVPVFVGGCLRSGTTLMAGLLGAAPGASSLTGTGVPKDEGQYLQTVMPYGQRGGTTRAGSWPQTFMDERDAVGREGEVRAHLWEAWSPFWDPQARWLVEKTPSNLSRVRFLRAVLPDSRFVILMRHPIAQALAVQKWSASVAGRYLQTDLERTVENWFRLMDHFTDSAAGLDGLQVVHYEHLVADPGTVVESVMRGLGMDGAVPSVEAVRGGDTGPYAERWAALAAHTRAASRANRTIAWNEGSAEGLARVAKRAARAAMIDSRLHVAVDRWVLPRVRARIVARFGERAAAYGYDIEDLNGCATPPPDA
ncbi:sulfotransferase [Demequina sp. NBRC 110051]|uniref:sulfotransferase family protein n=1 Tax=Demequina sp. NBRC 110051 TaxID=1570340 RepID=UPI000A037F24|nr:sulfotransferase [Demequina sp. NBRC 110051]